MESASSSPREELDKIRPEKTASILAEITFAELCGDNMLLGSLPESSPDTHVTVLPGMPRGRMTDFKTVMEKFCSAAKNGTTMVFLLYGFAEGGDKVWCREAYTRAQGMLNHLVGVKQPHEEGLNILGEAGVKVDIMGPASELEKLRSVLTPMERSSGNLTTRRTRSEPLSKSTDNADKWITELRFGTWELDWGLIQAIRC